MEVFALSLVSVDQIMSPFSVSWMISTPTFLIFKGDLITLTGNLLSLTRSARKILNYNEILVSVSAKNPKYQHPF